MRHKQVRDELLEIAKHRGHVITYETATAIANLDSSRRADREEMAQILGDISREEHADGKPLLSVLVVEMDSKFPKDAFFLLAQELHRLPAGKLTRAAKRAFADAEREAVYAYWAGPAAAPTPADDPAPS